MARFARAPQDNGLLAIIDDTVASGASIRLLKRRAHRIGRPHVLAVTFANPEASHLVDLFAVELPLPHFLEWNFFNSVHSPITALDFDGILCRDCRTEEDDDGPAYERFSSDAEPLYLPRRRPVPLIVTARLERYRSQTEQWLARWGIQCERLVMGPWSTLRSGRGATRPPSTRAGRTPGRIARSMSRAVRGRPARSFVLVVRR